MRKYILFIIFIFSIILVSSCGIDTDNHNNKNRNNDTATLTIHFYSFNNLNAFNSILVNAICYNALPGPTGAKTINWIANNITINSADPTINIVPNAACSFTLLQYIDGSGTYNPSVGGQYLTISLNSSGLIIPGSSVQYTGSSTYYFAAGTPSGAYNVAINYAITPSAATAPLSTLTLTTSTVSSNSGQRYAPPPTVSNLVLIKTYINGSTYFDYSLGGTISYATATHDCKTFPSSLVSVFNFSTIDSVYASGTACSSDLANINLVQANVNSLISGASAVNTVIAWADYDSNNNKSYTYTVLNANQ